MTNRLFIILAAVALALSAAHVHFVTHTAARLRTLPVEHHRAFWSGTETAPWQYRPLTQWMVHWFIEDDYDFNHLETVWQDTDGNRTTSLWYPSFKPRVDPAKVYVTALALEFIALFLLAGWYFRTLGISPVGTLMALCLLHYSMIHMANTPGWPAVDTWLDVCLYLAAAIAVLRGRPWWCVPIAALASLNRETSALICLMPMIGGHHE